MALKKMKSAGAQQVGKTVVKGPSSKGLKKKVR